MKTDPSKVKAWKRKPGKRTRKRWAMNRRLDKLGINRCELALEGCFGHIMLTWAHSKKSRFLITDDDWMQACRACISCHNKIEAMPHDEMRKMVEDAIARR